MTGRTNLTVAELDALETIASHAPGWFRPLNYKARSRTKQRWEHVGADIVLKTKHVEALIDRRLIIRVTDENGVRSVYGSHKFEGYLEVTALGCAVLHNAIKSGNLPSLDRLRCFMLKHATAAQG